MHRQKYRRADRLKHLLGFDDRFIVPVGIVLLGFFIPQIFFGVQLEGIIDYIPIWTSSIVYCTFYWVSIRAMVLWLREKFPYAKETPKRFIRLVPFIVALIFTCEGLTNLLELCFRFFNVKQPNFLQTVSASLFSTVIVTLIYEVIYLFVRYKNAEVLEAELRKENVQSQLDLLKNQVNPHFLFNSLNTLIYIIPDDPDKAVHFVHRLSKSYRNILQYRNEKLITVEKELDNLQDYLYLQKQRFQDNLNVTIAVPEDRKQYWIVPLSIQMLLENAIKHNVLSSAKPLHVNIESNDSHISVTNNLQRKDQEVAGTKVGLANIQKRYELLIGRTILIEESDREFKVVLPLIENIGHADRNH